MLKQLLLVLAFAVSPVFAADQATAPTKAVTAPAKAAAKPAVKPADATKPADTSKSAGNPKVKFTTSLGNVTVELYADKAPKTVENFLQYVKDGFYSGTVFHRVIPGFMVQGGGFSKDLQLKRARAPIHNEANNGLSNLRGTLAMARTGDPHSASAQFFVNLVDNQRLDYVSETNWGYCVYGKVVAGMDIVDKMAAAPTGPQGPLPSDVPTTPIVIEKAELVK